MKRFSASLIIREIQITWGDRKTKKIQIPTLWSGGGLRACIISNKLQVMPMLQQRVGTLSSKGLANSIAGEGRQVGAQV